MKIDYNYCTSKISDARIANILKAQKRIMFNFELTEWKKEIMHHFYIEIA